MKKRVVKIVTIVFALAVFCVTFLFVYTRRLALANETDIVWDGTTVANSFYGGNGTVENPYLITNGEELAFLSGLLKGDQAENYNHLYYAIMQDINLGSNEMEQIGTPSVPFSGYIDGRGHSIKNVTVDKGYVDLDEEETYYGLFPVLQDATIKNLNIEGINIIIAEKETEHIYLGSLAGKIITTNEIPEEETEIEEENNELQDDVIEEENIDPQDDVIVEDVSNEEEATDDVNYFKINNISISDINIDIESVEITEFSHVGSFVGYIDYGYEINNISLQGLLRSDSNENTSLISNYINSNVDSVFVDIESEELESYVDGDYSSISNIFIKKDDFISDGESRFELSDIAITFNNNYNSQDYTWIIRDDILFVKDMTNVSEEEIIREETNDIPKSFSFRLSGAITLHDSGVSGDTIYINDLTADYDHYMGLNYTDFISEGTTPDFTNKNIYNNTNLVAIYMKYSGQSIDSSTDIGHVSLDEQVSNYIYYKYYKVENGYVTIELIDNPYADRPSGKMFNGWITDYPGAKVRFDMDTYIRYVDIPVSSVANPISITMYASWCEGKKYELTSTSSTLTTAASSLSTGMVPTFYQEYPAGDYSVYYLRGATSNNTNHPSPAYDGYGNDISGTLCSVGNGTCLYYYPAPAQVNQNSTYYTLTPSGAVVYTKPYQNKIGVGNSKAGYFKQVTLHNGDPISGVYNSSGNPVTGTCNGTCTYYEYYDFYDSLGNPNVVEQGEGNTYYLTTRDTNIVVLKAQLNYTGSGTSRQYKNTVPMTITSIDEHQSFVDSGNMIIRSSGTTTRFEAGADVRIEYITMNSTTTRSTGAQPASSMAQGYIYGNWYNLKIGRGIAKPTGGNTRINCLWVIAGNYTTIASGSLEKYRLIVESGYYNGIVSGGVKGTKTYRVKATAIYGSDYDRITSPTSGPDIYVTIAESFGAYLYSESETTAGISTVVKSGDYGTSKHDYMTGIYVTGKGASASSASTNFASVMTIEGGKIYNIIGGILIGSSWTKNSVFIFVKGGTIDFLVGGAGQATTYGNRIVQVTGGQVNYAVCGGSNGYKSTSTSPGDLQGNSFVYIGGTAYIGGGSSSGMYTSNPGNVYGAGNGEAGSSYLKAGSVFNSNVMINGGTIAGNVYGGGNIGSVAASKTSGTYNAKIKMYTGTVNGSIYGGGNKCDATTANRVVNNYIDIYGGTIGNIYGGYDQKGYALGSVTINMYGGTVNGSVYGGGRGGFYVTSAPGTYVRETINVNIGNTNYATSPYIYGSVYGGSAFGSTNGTSNDGSATNTYTTNVNINKGTIVQNVFGGAKGGTDGSQTYTPKVYGNIEVRINGGSIGTVYGGFDQLGSPSNSDRVWLNGGTVGYVYGGGNNTGQTTAQVFAQGSTITNDIYGGSNRSGTVNTTYVHLKAGSAANVYGGNNQGGSTGTTIVDTPDASAASHMTVSGNIYGGGNRVGATTTNVTLDQISVSNVYGGASLAGTVTTSNVLMKAPTNITTVYGGNDAGGTTTTAKVDIREGTIGSVYGGGRQAETGSAIVDIKGGTVTSVYGGGDLARASTTTVRVTGGSVTDVYGGGRGNSAQVLASTNVSVTGVTIGNNVFGGGKQGVVSGNSVVQISNSNVIGSLYAGGDEAAVEGNTTVRVGGTSVIGTTTSVKPAGSVFGSGNAAATGTTSTAKSSTVEIVGGTIYGNVYGGANTSVVYGHANIKIGTQAVQNGLMTEGNIDIKGTIYGGGESNASGSPEYDYNAISVTEGINIDIDGTGYLNNSHTFYIRGSIFGSGNASSSAGESRINIKSLGTRANPSENLSIQRTTYLTIDNSVMHFVGTTDITNKYSNDKYSFNVIGVTDPVTGNVTGGMKIKNNTVILVDVNTNKLASFTSAVDVTTNGVTEEKIAKVEFDPETKTVTKNVDNRLYVLANTNFNVTKDEDASVYGKVTGMTFFGGYRSSATNIHDTGIYSDQKTFGSSATAADLIMLSSYVLGSHVENHDITVDGFYTNYLEKETEFTEIRTDYITPTPDNTNFYRWKIGTDSIYYEFTMTASKYLSMGTYSLSLIDFPDGDTTFNVLSFNSGELEPNLEIIDSSLVPKFINTATTTVNQLAITMKSESTEWTSYNETKYLSGVPGVVSGDKTYLTSSETGAPKLIFYLYHAKNIALEGDLGSVEITMEATTPKNAYEVTTKFVTIKIILEAKQHHDGDRYDASITYGKKYSMPAPTLVNITNRSQFTEYYSLLSTESFATVYGNNNDYYHSLVANSLLPIGSTITMIDISKSIPRYYYYEVDSTNYAQKQLELQQDNQVSYKLSDFISMDSTTTTNKYNDSVMNQQYYDTTLNMAYEEFLFIFDLKNTTNTGISRNNEILFELRNSQDRALVTVIDKRQEDKTMVYNSYDSSNIVLQQVIDMPSTNLYYNVPNTLTYSSRVSYATTGDSQKIIDTNYEESSMGMNVQFFSTDGTAISSYQLQGTRIVIGGQSYYVDSDGVFRIKLANKVTLLTRSVQIITDSSLHVGNYKVQFSILASSDGLHASGLNVAMEEKNVTVVGAENTITVTTSDGSKVYYADTDLNEDGYPSNTYIVNYSSQLENTNVRLSVYKRGTSNSTATNYNEIPYGQVFLGNLTPTGSYLTPYEVSLPVNSSPSQQILTLSTLAPSGTYKLVFKLCNGDTIIDTDEVFLIIKKPVVVS